MKTAADPVVLRNGRLAFGDHVLFSQLDVTVRPGEFVAVLGPNGAGKTSLLKVLLGLTALHEGTVSVCGKVPKLARNDVGYIPQQGAFDPQLPIRGCDFVLFGLNGTRPGLARSTRTTRMAVKVAIDAVGAASFADAPLGQLSGGEQQRLRVAQALLTDPQLLLCDEPLLSLDPTHQRSVCGLIDQRRRQAGTAVIFVTHEINPVLPFVDRVLYLAEGQWAIGPTVEVLTTESLTKLYRTPVEVLHLRDRILIVGGDDHTHHVQPPGRRSIR